MRSCTWTRAKVRAAHSPSHKLQQAIPQKGTRQASAETGADDDDDLDSISDATDCSDIFHIQALPEGSHDSGMRSWETYEDRVHAMIDRFASRMREYPLMPPDVGDPAGEATYRDMDSCIRLPLLHCAFKGCKCNISRGIYCSKLYHWQLEIEIYEHVKKAHTAEMEEVTEWIERRRGGGDLFVMKWTYSFYIAAVMQRER